MATYSCLRTEGSSDGMRSPILPGSGRNAQGCLPPSQDQAHNDYLTMPSFENAVQSCTGSKIVLNVAATTRRGTMDCSIRNRRRARLARMRGTPSNFQRISLYRIRSSASGRWRSRRRVRSCRWKPFLTVARRCCVHVCWGWPLTRSSTISRIISPACSRRVSA